MDSPMDRDTDREWKRTTLASRADERSPLLWAALLVLLVPLLACGGVWSVVAQPGPPRGLTVALMPDRTLELNLRPCGPAEPGRLTVWYIDATHANRFIRERFTLLVRSAAAPTCP
jgi:hypothetical protein